MSRFRFLMPGMIAIVPCAMAGFVPVELPPAEPPITRPAAQRHNGSREERRHDGRVAVDRRNTRWCSDALEIACDNGVWIVR
jgi:hypothetical protein